MLKSFLENMGEGRLVLENIEMIHFKADDTGKKSMLSLTQVQACSAKCALSQTGQIRAIHQLTDGLTPGKFRADQQALCIQHCSKCHALIFPGPWDKARSPPL